MGRVLKVTVLLAICALAIAERKTKEISPSFFMLHARFKINQSLEKSPQSSD
jgi:hypothetical protein